MTPASAARLGLALASLSASAFGQVETPAAPPVTQTPAAPAPATQIPAGASAPGAGATNPAATSGEPAVAPPRAWFFRPSVGVLETYTSNSAFGLTAGQGHSDLLSILTPSFVVAGRTPDLTVDGAYSAEIRDYARGTEPGMIAPTGGIDAKYALVPQQLFLDGGAVSARTVANAFGANPGVSSGLGTGSLTQVRLSPILESKPEAPLRYLLRSDTAWIHEHSDTTAPPDALAMRQKVEAERLPVPLGIGFSGDRETTRFDATSQTQILDEAARGIVRYSIQPELVVGVRGGYAHNNFAIASSDRSAPIYGGELVWKPGPNTQFTGYGEHRDLGAAWQASFTHEGHSLALDLGSSRSVTTLPQSLYEDRGVGNLSTLLDALYASRYPDPVQRSRAIYDLMSAQGLPDSVGAPVAVYMTGPIRLTLHQMSLSLLRPRDTLVFSAYDKRNEVVPAAQAVLNILPGAVSFADIGAGIAETHRLTRLSSLTIRFDWGRTTGLGSEAGTETLQDTVQVQYTQRLLPDLDGLIGARYRTLNSSLLGREHESALLAGIGYRFQ